MTPSGVAISTGFPLTRSTAGSLRRGARRRSEKLRIFSRAPLELDQHPIEMLHHGLACGVRVARLDGVDNRHVLAKALVLPYGCAQQKQSRAVDAAARRVDRGLDAVVAELGQQEVVENLVKSG